MRRPEPRKVAKYPEMWYHEDSDVLWIVYPDNKTDVKVSGGKWGSLGPGLIPWPEWMRRFHADKLFIGELK